MKRVVIKYAGGQQKVVYLGKDQTCVSAEPYGWGTSCKKLILKNDGYYHCNDCGLVFKKPVLKENPRGIPTKCTCVKLVNYLEWYFDECFGYDCPIDYYRCSDCGRIYKAPHYSREAPLKVQESEVAKEHVKRRRESDREEKEEAIDEARENVRELKEKLKQLPRSERKRISKELKYLGA